MTYHVSHTPQQLQGIYTLDELLLTKAPFQTFRGLSCAVFARTARAGESIPKQRRAGQSRQQQASTSIRTARVTASSALLAKSSAIPCINSPWSSSVRVVRRLLIGMRRIAGSGWTVQQGMGGPVLYPRKSPSHSLTLVPTSADPRRNVLRRSSGRHVPASNNTQA